MPHNRIPFKTYHYNPQGKRTNGRPKKRWREQLYLWRRNGPNGPNLHVYDDDINIISTICNQQTGLKFKEETNKVLCLENRFAWC